MSLDQHEHHKRHIRFRARMVSWAVAPLFVLAVGIWLLFNTAVCWSQRASALELAICSQAQLIPDVAGVAVLMSLVWLLFALSVFGEAIPGEEKKPAGSWLARRMHYALHGYRNLEEQLRSTVFFALEMNVWAVLLAICTLVFYWLEWAFPLGLLTIAALERIVYWLLLRLLGHIPSIPDKPADGDHESRGSATNQEKDPGYPEKLRQTEMELLKTRRKPANNAATDNVVGFGLSGGGIRSATFCLGIFQGLAKQKLLSKIDYLSTVSGGGYFGAFYGRLFTRKEVEDISDVEDILATRAVNAAEGQAPGKLPKGKVFRWLRENGRYLAPSGSGDVLLAGAAMLRNFIAVQLVLAIFILMIFIAAQLVRGAVEVACRVGHDDRCAWWGLLQSVLAHQLPGGEGVIWWSPYSVLVPILLLFFVVPPGWCYWLVEKPNRSNAGRWIPPFFGWLATLNLGLLGMTVSASALQGTDASSSHETALFWISLLVFIVALETFIWGLISGYVPRIGWNTTPAVEEAIFDDERVRLRLSLQLKTALIATGAALAFVVIDSLAQSFYGAALMDQFRPRVWLTAVLGPLIGLAGFGRTIVSSFGGKTSGKRFSIPLNLVVGAAAFLLVALLLITLDAGSYLVAWKSQMPLGPRPDWTMTQRVNDAKQLEVTRLPASTSKPKECGNIATTQAADELGPIADGWQISAEKPKLSKFDCGNRASLADLYPAAGALLITFIFSILFGWSWPFLNRSTHQSIYTSRLIRAYLGASNLVRLVATGKSVTQAISGDDIKQEDYWPRFRWLANRSDPDLKKTDQLFQEIHDEEDRLLKKGMPLHLVNVTINETLDARTQVEQRDRKGIGMAVGPAAISVGVVHHLVVATERDAQRQELRAEVYPPEVEAGAYRIFRYNRSPWTGRLDYTGEFLTLGNWTGISGAAFSTSLGWRTSLAFSLLAGLANVRLTYWWNSGVKPFDRFTTRIALAKKKRQQKMKHLHRTSGAQDGDSDSFPESRRSWLYRWLASAFRWLFAVQTFLFDELLARFHGTAPQWWPLSDGGHFENLGGYELIRRRLPVIVIIDAEADPDYTFEGLSNLVRKARLDFGAEIKFRTEEQLNKTVHSEIRKNFGTLEQLRRGIWVEEPIDDPTAPASEPAPNTPPPNGDRKARRRRSIRPISPEALSVAHAALADVVYKDDPTQGSLFLYIKPTLIGDESADVHRYHTDHPSFPHESTLQQFFDEAQWESYRKLGEHIALKLFQEPAVSTEGKMLPYRLLAPATT